MEYKAERRIIKGRLNLETGLHIGSGDEGDWIDSTIIKTKDGKSFVPATTIAGLFRELAEKNFKDSNGNIDKAVYELFGTIEEEGGFNQASRIIFCDAFLSGECKSGYRNGVGIKRDTLTSQEGALFSLETVERPIFDFKLIIDNPIDKDMDIIEPILAEFQSGRVAIGGDKSRGLGWLKLSDLKYADIKPDNLDSFVDYLVDGKENLQTLTTNKTRTEGKGNYTVIEYILTLEDIDASLIVSSGVPGFSADADQVDADQTLVRNETGRFFIPGSSIKGPFRSQAERIIRFLKGNNKNSACDPTDSKNSCSAKIREIKKQIKEIDFSTINCLSCPVCKIFGNGYLASRIFFTDAYDTSDQTTQVIENVAIDRFTGGALEGAKFNTKVATKVNLKGRLILKDIEEWQAGLVAFVLRDWITGDIRIGFGKMKGYGRCKVNLERITLCWKDENWLKDNLRESGKKGFYNYTILEGKTLNFAQYKDALDKLTKKLTEEVGNETIC